MSKATTFPATDTYGLDLGDRFTFFHRIDSLGGTKRRGRIPSTQRGFEKAFSELPAARMIIETGTHSPWVESLLREMGHEVVVANPRKVRAIHASERKNDQRDAEMLARIGRMDPKLLSPVRHRGPRARADLTLLKSRQQLVRQRARLVLHIRGVVKSAGSRLLACSTPTFHKSAAGQIPEELRPAVLPLLEVLAHLSRTIKQFDRQIQELCQERYKETARLQEIPGVGPITALAYVLTLERAEHFARSRTVGAFLGLVPRQSQSGQSDPQLRITKAGDRMLRSLLVQCAHYILGPFGPDTDLRRFGERLLARGGARARKQAVVAVARKLAVVLHALWRADVAYDPLLNTNKRARSQIET